MRIIYCLTSTNRNWSIKIAAKHLRSFLNLNYTLISRGDDKKECDGLLFIITHRFQIPLSCELRLPTEYMSTLILNF